MNLLKFISISMGTIVVLECLEKVSHGCDATLFAPIANLQSGRDEIVEIELNRFGVGGQMANGK